jgi:hypothetical protein
MIAKRLQYMPKARNRNRASQNEDKEQTNRDNGVIGYTLDEERLLASDRALSSADIGSSNIGGGKPDQLLTRAQEQGKNGASMWLKGRIAGSGLSSPNKLGPGGARAGSELYAGMQTTAFKNSFKSKHDSRYASNSSLPYKIPEKIDATADAKEEVDTMPQTAMETRVVNNSKRNNFNEFMRSTRFAAKRNSLVRQCIHCQVLYSTSHVCSFIAKENEAK